MPRDDLRRYAAPAAFLLAVTVAVVLVRAGMHSGRPAAETTTGSSVTTPRVSETATITAVSKPRKAPARKYWTVQAGDTFGVISSKSGVPVATLEQLNPTVHSTSLYIGEKVRIR